jgi:hypothetical protein
MQLRGMLSSDGHGCTWIFMCASSLTILGSRDVLNFKVLAIFLKIAPEKKIVIIAVRNTALTHVRRKHLAVLTA